MFTAKVCMPTAGWLIFRNRPIDAAAENPLTHIYTPCGYLLTDSLVAALESQHSQPMWVRIEPEDRDPATLLLTLISSARTIDEKVGDSTLTQMKSKPGVIHGWSPLFEHLSEEFVSGLPSSGALVLEQLHHFDPGQPAFGLLINHLLRNFPPDFARILIAHRKAITSAQPQHDFHLGIKDLQMDQRAYLALAAAITSQLTQADLQRAGQLVGGRPVALAGLIEVCRRLGANFVQQAIREANDTDQLLATFARGCLSTADPAELRGLALALSMGYFHPELGRAVLGSQQTATGPWLQDLVGGWLRIRSLWRKPLLTALRLPLAVQHEMLQRGADYLMKLGAVEVAVPIYLQLENYQGAVQAIAGSLEDLMNYGQWVTLKDWLKQIPKDLIHEQPWLVYAQAEIQAAMDEPREARHSFAIASRLFTKKDNPHGACQSLLGESTLAARLGDLQGAQISALQALLLAHSNNLGWLRAWTSWQLGYLSISNSQFDHAVKYFASGAQLADDPLAAHLIQEAGTLVDEQRELHKRRDYHQQELQQTEASLQANSQRLQRFLTTPPVDLPVLLERHGWFSTPLMLKLASEIGPPSNGEHGSPSGLLQSLSRLLGLERQRDEQESTPSDSLPLLDFPLNLPPEAFDLPDQSQVTDAEAAPAEMSELDVNRQIPVSPQLPVVLPSVRAEPATASLVVYCLGSFRVYQDDQLITDWPSSKGKSIFKYLVTHRERPVVKEVLMDLFWPDAPPDAARNNLNVAIYGLRQALRETRPSFSHVLFQDDCYLLNQELHIWVDCEAFTEHLSTGQEFERAGDFIASVREYHAAEALYQGEFLEEDRYEAWLLPQRQRYNEDYLILLDRLSLYHFDHGDYISCVTICRKMLAVDACREEAHRRLMHCYNQQGQPYLALRQYHLCVETLEEELGVPPTQETIILYEDIRKETRF